MVSFKRSPGFIPQIRTPASHHEPGRMPTVSRSQPFQASWFAAINDLPPAQKRLGTSSVPAWHWDLGKGFFVGQWIPPPLFSFCFVLGNRGFHFKLSQQKCPFFPMAAGHLRVLGMPTGVTMYPLADEQMSKWRLPIITLNPWLQGWRERKPAKKEIISQLHGT